MAVAPRDQLAATNRLRRALLAFQAAQILILTHQRQNHPSSQTELDAVRDSAVEAAAAFQTFSAAGLMAGAEDQRLLAQIKKYLADGDA
jgi:hypothetical protein